MKIWWIVDADNAYPLKGIPYLGKESRTRAQNLAHNVVDELVEPFVRTNRNITFDNYFTSYELCQSLLSKGLTSVGTLRKNKRCLPPTFLPNTSRAAESNLFGFRKNISLVSYVPKKNRCVLFLSTKHQTLKTDINNKNKSEVNLFYNKTKGGVDTLDQLCHAYTVRRKTNRWPMTFFQNLVDISGVAALVLWKTLYPEWKTNKPNAVRKIFIREVVMDLVTPHIRRRSKKGLTDSHLSNINQIIQPTNPAESPSSSPQLKRKKRCHLCPSKLGRMARQCCNTCNRNVCNEHSKKEIICTECSNN